MIYIAVGFGLFGIALYYFFVHRKRALSRKMLAGIEMVKMGIYGRLSERYRTRYEEEQSVLLAGAVVNELFSNTPSSPHAQQFLAANKETIQQELGNLRDDDEIRHAITQALRVKLILTAALNAQARGDAPAPLEKLRELGLLVAGGDTPTPAIFLPMAYEFLDSTPVSEKNENV